MPQVAGALASDRVGPIARWTPAAEILLLQLLNGTLALTRSLRRTLVKKLYLGNLPFKATEEQIAAMFAELGVQPDSLTLLRDRFRDEPRPQQEGGGGRGGRGGHGGGGGRGGHGGGGGGNRGGRGGGQGGGGGRDR